MKDQPVNHNKAFFIIFFIVFELAIIIIFGTCFKISDIFHPKKVGNYSPGDSEKELANNYGLFQDVNVMVFIGFGYLYTYLRYHTLSSLAINTVLAIFTFQWSILTQAFFKIALENENNKWKNVQLKLDDMIEGDFGAATFLISYGAVMGKATFPQLFFMSVIESIFYGLNYRLGEEHLHATDAGGSMFIHSFGAFFGIFCAWVLYYDKGRKIDVNPCNSSNQFSNTFAFIGTIFLWMYWPSFNTALLESDNRYRGIINSIFSMGGSCLGTFITAYLLHNGKLEAEDMLNASVSGGVFIGGSCNLLLVPYAALIVGFVGGIISTLGFEFIGKPCAKIYKLYDTAGILYLHGIPGVLGSIVTAITVACMTRKRWNPENSLIDARYQIIPKLADRSLSKQAGFQIAVEVITIAIASASGALTGLLMRLAPCGDNDVYFVDSEYWAQEEEEEEKEELHRDQTKSSNNKTDGRLMNHLPTSQQCELEVDVRRNDENQ